jgi:hypothetical protein
MDIMCHPYLLYLVAAARTAAGSTQSDGNGGLSLREREREGRGLEEEDEDDVASFLLSPLLLPTPRHICSFLPQPMSFGRTFGHAAVLYSVFCVLHGDGFMHSRIRVGGTSLRSSLMFGQYP